MGNFAENLIFRVLLLIIIEVFTFAKTIFRLIRNTMHMWHWRSDDKRFVYINISYCKFKPHSAINLGNHGSV